MSQLLVKTHKDSHITAFHATSTYAEKYLSYDSTLVVLQVMPIGDKYLVAELLPKTIYEQEWEIIGESDSIY